MQFFSENILSRLKIYLKVKENPEIHEQHLWKKVKKYQKIFGYIPGILCVCVCNSLAMNSAQKDSDIDLFVITKKNRLWTTRIFLTFIFALLGNRKTAHKHAGKFCLSFFISEEAMDFSHIAIEQDIYLAYWIETLVPIYNSDQSFEKFLEKNTWYEGETFSSHSTPLPNPLLPGEGTNCKGHKNCSFISPGRGELREVSRGIGKKLGNLLESMLKRIFLPRTQKSFQKLGKPFGVIISDNMLKFHNQDRRKIISQKVFEGESSL